MQLVSICCSMSRLAQRRNSAFTSSMVDPTVQSSLFEEEEEEEDDEPSVPSTI